MTKTIKEIIIMLLVCLVTMLVLAVVLYKYVPSKKIVPEITTYTAEEQVQDLLEDTIDEDNSASDVILTYEVTSSDLSNYQQTNDYVPGKSNPFASYTETTTTEDSSDSSETQSQSTTIQNNSETSNTTQNNSATSSGADDTNSYFKDSGTK